MEGRWCEPEKTDIRATPSTLRRWSRGLETRGMHYVDRPTARCCAHTLDQHAVRRVRHAWAVQTQRPIEVALASEAAHVAVHELRRVKADVCIVSR
jgi:hypothetical protein